MPSVRIIWLRNEHFSTSSGEISSLPRTQAVSAWLGASSGRRIEVEKWTQPSDSSSR